MKKEEKEAEWNASKDQGKMKLLHKK